MSFSLNYASIEHPRWKNLPSPPDFSNLHSIHTRTPAKAAAAATASYAALKEKRAWDLAISPAKSLPMQAFMLYMSGGGVQIFSMGIVLMLLLTPIKNIASMNAAFSPFIPTITATTTSNASRTVLLLQKLTYVLCNLLTLFVGLWKCRSMGLLPTGTADWLAFETRGVICFFVSSPALCASDARTAEYTAAEMNEGEEARDSPKYLMSFLYTRET